MASEMAPAIIVIAARLRGAENGLALAHRLKAHGGTENAVIVLTSYAADIDRPLAVNAGCDRFVTMPCLPDALSAIVQELLKARGAAATSDVA